jgi:3-hydroxyacyl-CoA dehydrogenase
MVARAAAAEQGFSQREFSNRDIVERCFLALVNLGCEVLREGVASRASDIDVVYIHGYGFPAYRGGPMYWAEHEVGLPAALDKLRRISAELSTPFMQVSPLLEQLVAEGRGLSSIGS